MNQIDFNELWIFFEIIVNIVQSFLIVRYICKFLKTDFQIRKYQWFVIFLSLSLSALLTVQSQFKFNELYFNSLYFLITFVSVTVFLPNGFLVKLFAFGSSVVCVFGVNLSLASFHSVFLNINSSDNLYSQSVGRFAMLILSQVLLFLAYSILLGVFKRKQVSLSFSEWIFIFFVFLVFVILSVNIHFYFMKNTIFNLTNVHMSYLQLGMLFFFVIIFYMVIKLNHSNNIKSEIEFLKQQNIFQSQYAENVKNKYKDIRRIRHDIKHSYNAIALLADEGNLPELQKYLKELFPEIQSMESITATKNDFVNAILDEKISRAERLGINTSHSVTRTIDGFNNADLCVLLGNILDNAIESCQKFEKLCNTLIDIVITANPNLIEIVVRNSAFPPAKLTSDFFQTIKKDKQLHGYGLKSVNRIAEKYGGYAKFYFKDGIFTSNVVMYVPEASE